MTDHIGMGDRLRLKSEWWDVFPYIDNKPGTVVAQTRNCWKLKFDHRPQAIHFAKTYCERAPS